MMGWLMAGILGGILVVGSMILYPLIRLWLGALWRNWRE